MPKVEEKITLKNATKNIIVAGAVRIKPGESIQIPESKISEGLRRLIGKELKKV